MKLPLKWLKEYVDYNVTNEEFVELLMKRGFETAEVADEMPGIKNVVVCTIKSIVPHPDAKKLRICSVDIGEKLPLQIVTNSQRVFEGAQVPVALCGATLADGMEIRPTSLRGVESFGMFCGGRELGLADADYPGAGIDEVLVFNEPHINGQRVQEAFDLDSVIFDIELTPNRADCQSIIGMCREAASALGQEFKEPSIREIEGEGSIDELAAVTVENNELCPRYCARVMTDIKIEPSPAWMQKRLRSVGLRPINNIVDITNYVLIEYGHPMHAFDLACVKDGHIVVRNAHEGEKVRTLDGALRDVTDDMLLIADPEKGVGIAGVMGGENSEITNETRTVLFESAVFKGSNIRSTSRKLRHSTDASARFSKGVEPVNAMLALKRAIELVDELGAGKVVGGTIDVCSADISQRVINVDWRHVNKIINLDLTPEKMLQMLGTIGICGTLNGERLKIGVPHFRTDIESGIEADWDIAEEIARLYGYEPIKPTLMRGDTFVGKVGPLFAFEDKVKDLLVSLGAYEMYSYNFTSPQDVAALRLDENDERRRNVKILNPFGEEQSLMRTTLISGMLKALALNLNKKTGHGRFFEVGNIHIDNEILPEQRKMIGIAYFGEKEDFFTLKGTVETLLERVGIRNVSYAAGGGEYFQPGQKAVILSDGEVIGEMGAIHPNLLKYFGIPVKAYVAELNFDRIAKLKNERRTYAPIPRYPVVSRDIAIVVDEDVLAADVANTIAHTEANVLIENVELFDVYRGAGIAIGKKSMAYSFTLRAEDHTLSDDEITAAMNAIIDGLSKELGAKLR